MGQDGEYEYEYRYYATTTFEANQAKNTLDAADNGNNNQHIHNSNQHHHKTKKTMAQMLPAFFDTLIELNEWCRISNAAGNNNISTHNDESGPLPLVVTYNTL
jgi:hypothetical protein